MKNSEMHVRDLIDVKRQWSSLDAGRMKKRPDGYPRTAWRDDNPIDLCTQYAARRANGSSVKFILDANPSLESWTLLEANGKSRFVNVTDPLINDEFAEIWPISDG